MLNLVQIWTLHVPELAILSRRLHGDRNLYFYIFITVTFRSAPSDVSFDQKQDPNAMYNKILLVNDLSKNAEFVCHVVNKHGAAEKPIDIVVVGPGNSH